MLEEASRRGRGRVLGVAASCLALVAVVAAGCGGGGDEATDTAVDAAAEATTGEPDADLAAEAKRLIPIASQSQAVASKKESLRIADAQSRLLIIAQEDPSAIAPLTAALEKPDYELILDIYNFYIQLGEPGSEKVLVEALNREGFSERSSPVAFAFLASGNKKLAQGAKQWAEDNGLTITGNPGGVVGPRWGQVGAPIPDIPTAPPPAP